MTALQAEGIEKRFGGVKALTDARFDLEAGEVHVLIGSNGSGKSTLCKIIAGTVAPDAGTLRLAGRPVTFSGPEVAAQAGIAVFYQELSLVPKLSVEANMFLGREPRRAGLVDRKRLRADTESMLQKFAGVCGDGLTASALVSDLTADQRQIVEILKVLGEGRDIIIFDEPTSSLDNRQVEVFFGLVEELKRSGRSIVFISHRMNEVFTIGDRVSVIRNGRTVATLALGDTDENEVVRLMVGGEVATREGARSAPASGADASPLLVVDRLDGARVRGASFELRRGEVLGLGGLHGQGQSDLLRGLFGAEPARAARVTLDGEALRLRGPSHAIRAGIAYVSGDRGRDGAFGGRSIFENLVSACLVRYRHFAVRPATQMQRISPIVERLKTRFSSYRAPISELSGGNQQKVVIGRWLAAAPRVLLLDDPTKGIDIEAKRDLYRIIHELSEKGVAIILYSSEDTELLSNVHRVLVFNAGRVVRELEGEDINAFELYRAAYEVAA